MKISGKEEDNIKLKISNKRALLPDLIVFDKLGFISHLQEHKPNENWDIDFQSHEDFIKIITCMRFSLSFSLRKAIKDANHSTASKILEKLAVSGLLMDAKYAHLFIITTKAEKCSNDENEFRTCLGR